MKPTLNSELEKFKNRLQRLLNEDDKNALEIKSDLFLLIKTTGQFEEYLESINMVEFFHKNTIYNKGHIKKVAKFIDGKEHLLRIIKQIQKEIELGGLKPKLLPKPEKLTLIWLFKNSDLKFWISVLMIFAFIFSLGVFAENRYKVGKTIVPWLLSPKQKIQESLQTQKK